MTKKSFTPDRAVFIPFFSSLAVFFIYFIEFRPAVYSWDSIGIISAIHDKELFNRGVSYLYNLFLYLNFMISPDFITATITQIILAITTITKTFETIYRHTNKKLAYAILFLILLNPNIIISSFWIHRTSLFGWLFFLNVVLLYKAFKSKKLSAGEEFCLLFLPGILAAIRLDGLVFGLFGLLSFFKLSRSGVKRKRTFLYSSLAILIILKMIPYASGFTMTKNSVVSLSHNIKKIKNLTNTEFNEEDKKILTGILKKKVYLKKWFGPETCLNTDIFRYEQRSNAKWVEYFIWSAGFMAKNFDTLSKSQFKTFKKSSFMETPKAYYFQFIKKSDSPKFISDKIPGFSSYMSFEIGGPIPVLRKILDSVYIAPWLEMGPFLYLMNIFFLGTAAPFLASIVYIVCALLRKKSVFYVILPVFFYNLIVFIAQPAANAYYWYYLAISSYFIVFIFGYEVFLDRKASPLSPSS